MIHSKKLERCLTRYAIFRHSRAPEPILNAELELIDEALMEEGYNKKERILTLYYIINDESPVL